MSNAAKLTLMAAATVMLLSASVLLLANGAKVQDGAQQAAKNVNIRNNGQLANIAEGCAASVGDDGFGRVNLDRRLIISNEEGEIKVPCRLILERGGELVLDNVKLRSDNLTIIDDAQVSDSDNLRTNGETGVRINNSDLIATGDNGLWVQLYDAEDSVAIHHSTLHYPLNVWVRASGVAENEVGGGRIEVTNTQVRSMKAGTEQVNVQFVAGEQGGFAKFNRVRFDTPEAYPGTPDVLLYAGTCQKQQVQGGSEVCDPAGLAGLKAGQGEPIIVDGRPYVPPRE